MMIKISLCICFYNSEGFIKRALDSFVEFLTDEIEVVLVDDGSSDNSVSIIHEYMINYNQLKLVKHETNKGLSSARKTAVDNSRGSHVLFLDSDDEFIKNPFEFFLGNNLYQNYDVIEYGAMSDTGEVFLNNYYDFHTSIDGIIYLNDYFRFKNKYVMLCLRLFRKELFFPVSFLETQRVHDDNPSLPLIISRAKKVIVIDKYFLRINFNPDSLQKKRLSVDIKKNSIERLKIKASLFHELINHLDTNIESKQKNITFRRFQIQMALNHSFYSAGESLMNMLKRQKGLKSQNDLRTFLKFKTIKQIKSPINIFLIVFGFQLTSLIVFLISKLNVITNQKLKKVV